MKRRQFIATANALGLTMAAGIPTVAQAQTKSNNQNPIDGNVLFGRCDPAKLISGSNAHGGAGSVRYLEITPREKFKSQFLFVHRGVMSPKSSIGEHAHRRTEEVYFILEKAPVEFTVNGRTALIMGPACVLCPMGSSHGIYNRSDRDVEWMNIGIAYENRTYDAVNFAKENDLVDNVILENPAPFPVGCLDEGLLRPVPALYNGSGTMLRHDIITNDAFRTNLAGINHYILPPGQSIPYHRHEDMEEVYYVLSGNGRMTVDDVTKDVHGGDAGSVVQGGRHGIYNSSSGPLAMLAIPIAMKKGTTSGIALGDDLKKR